MKAWPVDFAGFTTASQIIGRIDHLEPQVWKGHEDLCWASWEIERLNGMLYEGAGLSPMEIDHEG